ncbi:NAD-dependent epimerase/dehydratase family protein [bacterium]|nr:NAD-dependent epimerase/dehydratase family protein [bacterium]
MKSSVLVVGGAGYVGSHMLVSLQDAGFAPVVFDNLSRGHRDAIGDSPLFRGDLRRLSDIESCLQQNNFNLIFHFAALAYVGESVADPDIYYQNKDFLNDIMFELNDGGQRFNKNYSLKTESIEVIIKYLITKGVSNNPKSSPYYIQRPKYNTSEAQQPI